MSSTTFIVMVCDRCGHEKEVRQATDKAGWATISAVDTMREERPRMIGSYQQPADTCPGCAELLFAWWEARDAVVQPASEVAPPAPRRFTVEDRASAIETAKGLLRGQADQALAAAREQPTSLLDGRMLPEGLHGLDERATALVDAIVARLQPEPMRLVEVAE